MLRRSPTALREKLAEVRGEGARRDQLVGVRARAASKRRIESAGPSTESGGMTTLTREPSASRASAIGLSSSTRRPSGARIRSIASRSARSESNRTSVALDPPPALDVDVVGPVDHHLLDRRVGQQLLQRPEADRVAQDQLADLLAPASESAAAWSSTSSATAASRLLAARAPCGRLGAPALEQAAAKVRGQRLGVAFGDAHDRVNPRAPATRPGVRVRARRSGYACRPMARDRGASGGHHQARGRRDRERGEHRPAARRRGRRRDRPRRRPEIQDESDRVAPIGLGEAVATGAGELPARWVIHAATMELGGPTSAEVIRAATASTLRVGRRAGRPSLGLVAFGTGVGGFPIEEAARIEVEEVRRHLEGDSGLERVVFCVFGEHAQRAFDRALSG